MELTPVKEITIPVINKLANQYSLRESNGHASDIKSVLTPDAIALVQVLFISCTHELESYWVGNTNNLTDAQVEAGTQLILSMGWKELTDKTLNL